MVIQTTSVVRTLLRLYRMIPKFHYIECKGYPLYKRPIKGDLNTSVAHISIHKTRVESAYK